MMKPGAMLGAVVAALAVSSTPGISQQPSQSPAREGPTLILAAKVPLTGVAGRIDHFTFDVVDGARSRHRSVIGWSS